MSFIFRIDLVFTIIVLALHDLIAVVIIFLPECLVRTEPDVIITLRFGIFDFYFGFRLFGFPGCKCNVS